MKSTDWAVYEKELWTTFCLFYKSRLLALCCVYSIEIIIRSRKSNSTYTIIIFGWCCNAFAKCGDRISSSSPNLQLSAPVSGCGDKHMPTNWADSSPPPLGSDRHPAIYQTGEFPPPAYRHWQQYSIIWSLKNARVECCVLFVLWLEWIPTYPHSIPT